MADVLPMKSSVWCRGWWAAWAAASAIFIAMIALLRFEGRIWFSKTGRIALWHGDVWSSECSQQLFDPYSFTHVSHGLIFAGAFAVIGALLSLRIGWRSAGLVRWQLVASIAVAAAWEVAENSRTVIDRYRTATMSLDYLGDSVFNSVGDVVSCVIGFVVARRLGLWRSLAVFTAVEFVLLWLIRDNLTLNVIMLVRPIDAIRQWQSVGH